MKRLIVIDGNAPWVRALFLAMPREVEIRLLHVGQPAVFRSLSKEGWLTARKWRKCGENAGERWIIIPGWNKAPGLSTWLTNRAVVSAAGGDRATGIVLALPQFAGVAEATGFRPRIYYAHDPFEFYGWDRQVTRTLETGMLGSTEMTFAISRLLRDDLQARTTRPVVYSPNAVSSDFVSSMQMADPEAPVDLAGVPHPIVGCTGQINETYDWAMLAELVHCMSDVSFVFIGPVAAPNPEVQRVIDNVLKGRVNVHWLGPKPHGDLPKYLRAFDVCLNPLAPGPHADRRSPLRLYDFLATGKPVVSTAIEEASAHEGQVGTGTDASEIESLIRAAISGERQVDAAARREYVQRNTWQARARTVLDAINQQAAAVVGDR